MSGGPDAGRVLFLTPSRDVVGGAEESVLGLLKYYPPQPLTPMLVCPDGGEMAERARGLGVAHRPWQLPGFELGLHPRKWWPRHRAVEEGVRQLQAATASHGTRLITSHALEAHVVAGYFSRRFREPVVWHIRDLIPQRGIRAMFRWVEARGRVYPVFVSQATRRAYYGGSSGPVLSDGLDWARFSDPATSDPANPVFVYVGQLLPRKGLHLLIRAWRQVASARPQGVLRIIGDGDPAYVNELKRLAAPAGDRVEFLGRRTDVETLLPHCTALVLPSRHEALGLVLLEAMAVGVPVVASRDGGMTELVEDGVTGYSFTPGDEADLARVLGRILDQPEEARRVAHEARRFARREYDAETQARRVAAYHHQVLGAL